MPGNGRADIVLALVTCSLAPACAEPGRAAFGDLDMTRDSTADTTFVTIRGGSAWVGGATLEPSLAIGSLEGADEYTFGRIQYLAADDSGGVYVFDGQARRLRHYDAAGRYIRTLGGDGAGPGEYRDAVLGMAVRSDGRLILRDPRNARINVYDPGGEPVDHWPVASGLFTANALVLDTADHMYLKVLTGPIEENRPWPVGLLHLDDRGQIVDTIPPPAIAGAPDDVGNVRTLWVITPLGHIVVGSNDTYSFEIRRQDGVVRVVMEHVPVSYTTGERAELEARNDFVRRTQGQFMTSEIPPVPAVKPAYRGIHAGEDGRIWIHRHVAAERDSTVVVPDRSVADPPPVMTWREPAVFDVFEPDGTYLGQVRLPPRTSIQIWGRTWLWGVQRGEFDEPYVVRLRLIEPPA